jgi:hypothetical protein
MSQETINIRYNDETALIIACKNKMESLALILLDIEQNVMDFEMGKLIMKIAKDNQMNRVIEKIKKIYF